MLKHLTLRHRFTTTIPENLAPGVLYISMDYATAAHSCCCGCGEEVVTPFTPTDWKMEFDGASVSLHPSVGSWSLPCRSHYVVRRGKVIEAAPWSEEQIEAERNRDRAAKTAFYTPSRKPDAVTQPPPSVSEKPAGPLTKLLKWLGL